jgi:hypothetical protein
MRTSLIGLIVFTLTACGPPETQGLTWDSLDFESYKQRFEAPTGQLNQDSVKELVDQIGQLTINLSEADSVSSMLSQILGAQKPGAKQGAITLENTQLYAKLSCIGPNLELPDLDFQHGHIRIDSPNISEDSLFSGDALMSFADCVISNSELGGKSPAYYDKEKSLFAMGLDLLVRDLESNEVRSLVFDLMLSNGELWTLLEDQVGDSFALKVDPDKLPNSFSLKGSNGTFSCYIKEDKLGGGCDGPDDLKFEVEL